MLVTNNDNGNGMVMVMMALTAKGIYGLDEERTGQLHWPAGHWQEEPQLHPWESSRVDMLVRVFLSLTGCFPSFLFPLLGETGECTGVKGWEETNQSPPITTPPYISRQRQIKLTHYENFCLSSWMRYDLIFVQDGLFLSE